MSDVPARVSALTQILRILRVGLHVLAGAFTALFLPSFAGPKGRAKLIARWSHKLLRILGIEPRIHGAPVGPGVVYVMNHVSWLDIHVLHTVSPHARFVSKAEVRHWPVIGWLACRVGTLFLERGRKQDTLRVNREIRQALVAGDSIALFPEGTTTGGSRVLPFKASLLQPAVDTGVPIVPVALRFLDANGKASLAPTYVDDMSFGESLARIAAADGVSVELRILDPLHASGCTRRELADAAHDLISAALFPAVANSRSGTGSRPRAAER